ncbi:MAG: autotransporter-associated beta strand repeat-containing protein [Verrucomicrobia bacterium]|nr:autotransporter-associated beta strand repeat-containing protein [Verrucomicrobiota bacterium]
MKSKTLAVFLAAFFVSQSARSATFTWNGGDGDWDTTSANWSPSNWVSASTNDAVFGGTAGTVTINTGTGVTANKLTFNSDGYFINGNIAADTLTLAGTTPTVTVTTAGQSATVNAIINGTVGLTKAGAGTLVLNGANTYTGTTELSAGTLVIGHVDAMSGTLTRTSGSGTAILRLATDTSVSAFQLNSGTNRSYTVVSDRATSGTGITHALGSASLGGGSTNITFEAGGNVTSGTAGISLSSLSLSAGITAGGTLTTTLTPTTASLTILGNVTRSGATTGSTKILALAGSSTGNSVGGSINNGDADDIVAVTKSGTSTWTLNGTNSNYTGVTTISGGVLEAAALANGGSNSSIGASANAATSLVFGASTATLRYIGSSNVTIDRGFTTSSGAGGGATIESSGTGTLTLDNTVAIGFGTNNETRTLTLGGTNTGGNTFSKTLANNGTAATSLNKTGTGTWIVNGGNSFTGPTNISGGTLVAGSVGALTTSSAVNISTATGSGTLRLATDTSVDAYLIGLSSSNPGTIVSDRATSGAGLTHVLGAASVGANAIHIQAGGNVSSGTAGVSFASLSLASGGGGITLLNPVASVLTITGAVNSTSNSAKTLDLGGTSAGNTISGVISNGTNVVSLAKSNTSTWTLDGASANTYTGTTSVSGGTLVLAKTAGVNAIPGSLTIGDGTGIDIVQLSNGNQIADTGVAAFNGTGANAGILRLNNQSETIGGLSSTGGAGIVENGNASAGTSTLTLNVSSGTQTFSGILQNNGGSGSGVLALTKSGSGTQVLSGNNSYSGATTVSTGVLRITNDSALGTTANGTTVVGAATLEISGGISTGEPLTLQGNNTASSANQLVSVSGNNTITANISNTSGGTNHSITSLAGKLTIDANISPIVNGTRPLYLRGAGDGEITGGFNQGAATTAPLIKEGTGTWTLSGTSTYNGDTTISGGTLQIGNGGTTGRLTATSGITNNANLTINRNNAISQATDLGAGAVISGTGSFTQAGTGTTTLTADNTYTGTTSVNAGALIVNGTHSGTGAVSVASGAKLGGGGVLAASTSVSGILAPGNSIGTLTVQNDVTWQGAATAGTSTDWQFELGLSNTSDLINITGGSSEFIKDNSLGSFFRFDFLGSNETGTFTLASWESSADLSGGALGTNFLLSDFSYTNLGGGNTGTFGFNGTSLQFTVVPEPDAALLGGIGILLCFRRKRG